MQIVATPIRLVSASLGHIKLTNAQLSIVYLTQQISILIEDRVNFMKDFLGNLKYIFLKVLTYFTDRHIEISIVFSIQVYTTILF